MCNTAQLFQQPALKASSLQRQFSTQPQRECTTLIMCIAQTTYNLHTTALDAEQNGYQLSHLTMNTGKNIAEAQVRAASTSFPIHPKDAAASQKENFISRSRLTDSHNIKAQIIGKHN
ncbi:hypothetical protein Tcan_05040 [Toxocara canis]|uniref:Uncharacterized protein n=1 Tax=Toxocara canis TaxID=6265 RepID=A0A0B2V8F0_TOXCA|nr:hypothetical protein Tcan_05040 [Toxocara canis]